MSQPAPYSTLTATTARPTTSDHAMTLISRFLINAEIESVWQELSQPEQWPSWWSYVKQVELLEQGDSDDMGSLRKVVWGTALPYSIHLLIRTLQVEKPHTIAVATQGDLQALGCWQLASNAQGTWVTYIWQVQLEKAWMRYFALVLKPLFAWNHHYVMQAGANALAQRLDAKLISYTRLANPSQPVLTQTLRS